MELLIYLLAYLLTVWFIFFPKSLSKKPFFIFWYIFSICLSLIIRSSIGVTESADIDGYIINMTADEIIPYFLREPIFWFGIRFLYDIFGSGVVVFVILDSLLFILIYYGFYLCQKAFYSNISKSNMNYLYFAALLFFPYVMGMHNIYRQIIATAIFIIVIGLVGNKKTFRGYITSLIAVLIHNPVAFFLPVLVMTMKNNLYKYSSFIVLGLIILFLQALNQIDTPFLAREDSIEIGKNIPYLYLISLYVILGFVLLTELNTKDKVNSYFLSILIISTVFYTYSTFTFSSEQSQRFIFYIFGLLFPFFGFYLETRFKPVILSRLIFFHVSLAPLILIYNTTIDVSL